MEDGTKQVTISALGALKKYLSEETGFELIEGALSLGDQVAQLTGIPASESRISYVVNGQIQKATYVLSNGDRIVVLKMGGAG